ncbi:hypothetical protein SO802_011397 [Lithocarpus litseifolius]|uniref:Uncharacterized protein n=1 Tax=Lithocarpus litseifolius TaxID=425828 RepID=A0AAW2D0G8_9ROSI
MKERTLLSRKRNRKLLRQSSSLMGMKRQTQRADAGEKETSAMMEVTVDKDYCRLLGFVTEIKLAALGASVTHVLFMASSSSSASTVNTSAPPSPTTLTTIHHLITIKLTHDYLLWKAQIVPYLKG